MTQTCGWEVTEENIGMVGGLPSYTLRDVADSHIDRVRASITKQRELCLVGRDDDRNDRSTGSCAFFDSSLKIERIRSIEILHVFTGTEETNLCIPPPFRSVHLVINAYILVRIGVETFGDGCEDLRELWIAPQALNTFHDVAEVEVVLDSVYSDLVTLELGSLRKFCVDDLIELLRIGE